MKKFKATVIMWVVGMCLAKAQQMNAGIPVFLHIELESGAITVPSFASSSDLQNGLETSEVRFQLKTNVDWKVVTEIGTIVSTPVPAGPATILHPLTYSNFKYAVANGNDPYGTMTPFTSTTAIVNSGEQQEKKFRIKFRITPGFSVDPAAYTIPITYTISPL